MNIHGYKQKIKEIQQELKKGANKLGFSKYNRLKRRKQNLQAHVRRLKKDREVKRRK